MESIIAVKNVKLSASWYEAVFDCTNAHAGDDFAVLKDTQGEVLICLHQWGEHDHPTMQDNSILPGNGLILYFRTNKMSEIRQNLENLKFQVENEIHYNENTMYQEFALRDLDGYYIIVSEYHEYEG